MQIIEFLGMPRAGKTTQIRLLEKYLNDKGYSVGVIQDRGRSHSIATPSSEHLAYVVALSSIALEEYFVHQDKDVLLMDRGFNDITVWANLYHTLGTITKQEQQALVTIFDHYARLVSLTFYFQIKSHTSVACHAIANEHHEVDDTRMVQPFLEKLERTYQDTIPLVNNVIAIDGYQTINKTFDQINATVLKHRDK